MADIRPGYLSELETWCHTNLDKFIMRSAGDWGDCRCPYHSDDKPSARVSFDKAPGRLFCQSPGCAANGKGIWIDEAAKACNLTPPPVKTDFKPKEKRKRKAADPNDLNDQRNWPVTAEYPYPDAKGQPYAVVLRKTHPQDSSKKTFRQKFWDPDKKKWEWKKIRPYILWRLPVLARLKPGSTVLILEGEKDVLTAENLGFHATCPMGGAGGGHEVEDWSSLDGMNVVLVQDNDEAGKILSSRLIKKLAPYARAVKVVCMADEAGWNKVEKSQHQPDGTKIRQQDEGKDFSDWVADGGTRERFLQFVKSSEAQDLSSVPTPKPTVVINDRDPHQVDLEIAGILAETSGFYAMDGKVVQIRENQFGRHIIEDVTKDQLATIIQEKMLLVNKVMRKEEDVITIKRPSKDIVSAALVNLGHILPRITRVTDLPFFTKEGKLVAKEGFHEESGTYLLPFADLKIPTSPTREDVDEACRLILEDMLGEFWFADHTSRVHAFCACLQHFVIDYINEFTPAYLFSANRPSVGKTYLAQCIARIVKRFGAKEILESEGFRSDELEKKTNGHLLSGEQIILLDNIQGKLRESWIHGYLTSSILSVRPMRTSQIVSMPNKHLWFITANVPSLSPDVTSRTVPIELYVSPLIEDPSERNFPRNTKTWVEVNRSRIVEACLTILVSWMNSGRPEKKGNLLSRFPRWARIMGGICDHVGLDGFLATQRAHLQEVDAGAKERREVLAAVVETKGMVNQEDANFFYATLEYANALPQKIEDSKKCEAGKIRELGRYLSDMAKMTPIAGSYRITLKKCPSLKKNLYSISLTSCSIDDLRELPGTLPGNPRKSSGLRRPEYRFKAEERSKEEPVETNSTKTGEPPGNFRELTGKVPGSSEAHNQAVEEPFTGNPGNFCDLNDKKKNKQDQSDKEHYKTNCTLSGKSSRGSRYKGEETVRLTTTQPPDLDPSDPKVVHEVRKLESLIQTLKVVGPKSKLKRVQKKLADFQKRIKAQPTPSTSPPDERTPPTPEQIAREDREAEENLGDWISDAVF